MKQDDSQNYRNHMRLDPLFHFFLVPVAVLNLIYAIYQLTQRQGFVDTWFFVFSLAFVVAVFKLRFYALKVQDRLIRLEERLRLAAVLPEALRSRIVQLSEGQLIGLRFAQDEELPGLVEKALASNWTGADIKKAIVHWRPDYYRV